MAAGTPAESPCLVSTRGEKERSAVLKREVKGIGVASRLLLAASPPLQQRARSHDARQFLYFFKFFVEGPPILSP